MKFFLVLSLMIFSIIKTTAEATETSCAKPSIVWGGDCNSLKIEFDVSKCNGSHKETIPAKLSCKKKSGVATANDGKNKYFVKVKLSQNTNGVEAWDIDGNSWSEDGSSTTGKTDTSTQKPTQPTPPQPESSLDKLKKWSINANFDLYYAYNANKPADIGALATNTTALPGVNNKYHFYDGYARQMSLNLAELTLKHTGEEINFLLDLDFGQMADINAATPPNNAVDGASKNIGQAFITYAPKSAPQWSFDIGKMATHLGLEVIKAKDNWNYSRSALFSYAIPVWHTGAHANFAASSQLNIGAYIYNGWNTSYSVNSGQTFGWQFKYTPNEALTILYNGITGPQKAANTNDKKPVHEANVTYTLNPKVAFAADVVYGMEEKAVSTTVDTKWFAYSVAFKYQIDDNNYFSPRYESFKDENGSVLETTDGTLQTITLTYSHKTTGGLEVRGEIRQDNSNGTVFTKDDGSKSKVQTIGLVGLLYSI